MPCRCSISFYTVASDAIPTTLIQTGGCSITVSMTSCCHHHVAIQPHLLSAVEISIPSNTHHKTVPLSAGARLSEELCPSLDAGAITRVYKVIRCPIRPPASIASQVILGWSSGLSAYCLARAPCQYNSTGALPDDKGHSISNSTSLHHARSVSVKIMLSSIMRRRQRWLLSQ